MSTTASQLEPVPTDVFVDTDAPAEVKARGWEQVWIRFRRDRFAVASIFVIVFLVVAELPWCVHR